MTENNNKIHNYEIDIEQIENAEVDDLMLSPQQKRVWELYADMSNTEVAEEMELSPNTIRKHLELIYQKRQEAKNTLTWLDRVQKGELGSGGLDEFDSNEDNNDTDKSNTDTSQNRNTSD